MIKTNFHMHTVFCDGKNIPEDYVMAALNKKMTAIGFSAHVPITLANAWNMKQEKADDYFAEIARLKQKYKNQIEIYCGLEIDYLGTENKDFIAPYIAKADYTIGSVHYVYDEVSAKYYSIDGSEEDVREAFIALSKGDHQVCVEAYYHELIRVVREFKPNIVGHLDVIKKRNKNAIYFNESSVWYRNLLRQVLDEIKLSGAILEVNTGGMSRGFIKDIYPSSWILHECYKKQIPIVISSDAHKPEDIDSYFVEVTVQLMQIGFTKQRILKDGVWQDCEILG